MTKLNMNHFYENYKKGDFKPLINILITQMWEKQEGFTYQGFEKKLKEIPGPTNTFSFAQQLLETLDYAIEKGMYTEVAGVYYPKPYKYKFPIINRKFEDDEIDGQIGPSEERVKELLREAAEMLGIKYNG